MNNGLAVLGAMASAVLFAAIASAAEPAAMPPAAVAATDPMQQIVCRKDKETGSLVKVRKTCHSRAQWAYIDDTNQTFSRDLVDASRTKSGGN